MKPKFKIVYICLVAGIVLFGWGVCARLGQAGAIVMPPPTPNTSPGADNTLQLKHIISYRHLRSSCEGGCHVEDAEPNVGAVTVGRYLGGFVTAWRNCDHWKEEGYTMTCTDEGGDGNFVSAFGILIVNEEGGNPSNKKVQLLIPLSGRHILDPRQGLEVNVPVGWWDDRMMWTKWDIKVGQQSQPSGEDPSTTYSYEWAGYVGGGCETDPVGVDDLCGRVALEHNFRLSP